MDTETFDFGSASRAIALYRMAFMAVLLLLISIQSTVAHHKPEDDGFDKAEMAWNENSGHVPDIKGMDNGYVPVDEVVDDEPGMWPGPPLADGLDKWLGNIYSRNHIPDFANYWNQVTPENASKWGSVERSRGNYSWGNLDAAYNLAKDNDMPFRFHVLLWGGQQPGWINDLSEEEQLEAIEDWFHAVNDRYDDIDYLEVVNEPLHQRPDGVTGTANYYEALGGRGETGWDWIITAFQMARDIFPEKTRLMINDYNIINNMPNARQYREIIELLLERGLIDGIGVQGHAFSTRGAASGMVAVLDYLGETGLPIQVTEMDIDGNPYVSPFISEAESDRNQLEDMQRIFPPIWEHPSVEGVTFWGWRYGLWRQEQQAYLVTADNRERPALIWLREYLQYYPDPMPTTIENETGEIREFRLSGNYPNPFNPTTKIRYEISEQVDVLLRVYDITGRYIQTLVNKSLQAPGQYTVTFDGAGLASGVYIYRLQAGSFTDTRRMMLVK